MWQALFNYWQPDDGVISLILANEYNSYKAWKEGEREKLLLSASQHDLKSKAGAEIILAPVTRLESSGFNSVTFLSTFGALEKQAWGETKRDK